MGDFSITPQDLYRTIGSADAPIVLDVCRCEAFEAQPWIIPTAAWRAPEAVGAWMSTLPRGAPIVVVCVKGLKVSQAVAAELRLAGYDAAILAGGNEAWKAAGLPTVKKAFGIGGIDGRASRWVTRVRPKIDRIACPWLVARFIDRNARFFYVEPEQVVSAAAELGAIPYDVDGVELSHEGERCSFDTLIARFAIADPALDRVASIVRGADTARPDLAPEAAGLLAISLGNSQLAGPDDHVALERGFAVYDALYAWARFASNERHNWPARAGA